MDATKMLKRVRQRVQAWTDVRRIILNEFDRRHAEGAIEAYLEMQEFLTGDSGKRGRPLSVAKRKQIEKDIGVVADRRRRCGLPEDG